MDGIEKVAGLREEGIFQFIGGCNPVSCTDNNRGCVELVKRQLCNFRSHCLNETPTLTRIASEDNLASFGD